MLWLTQLEKKPTDTQGTTVKIDTVESAGQLTQTKTHSLGPKQISGGLDLGLPALKRASMEGAGGRSADSPTLAG